MSIEIFSDTCWSVKTCLSAGVPYLCAKDVAKALGYAKPRKAITDHVFEEDLSKLENLMGPKTGPYLSYQEKTSVYISEPGVYALIFGSKLDSAKVFKKWVCQTVLPRLRKSYQEQQKAPLCLRNESDLHHKVVHFIRRFYPQALLVAGLGELQDSAEKRLYSYKCGYTAGQPDIIICNEHAKYRGFAIELKSPRGTGKLTEKQDDCLGNFALAGYKTTVSDEYDVLLLVISEYMRDVRLRCPHCVKKFKSKVTLSRHLHHFHKLT